MKRFLILLLSSVALSLAVSETMDENCNHRLYYTTPTKVWEETLPLGNGRLEMMPDGGILREHIVLNEISMWSGTEADYCNPNASDSLLVIRRLLFEGKNIEVQKLMYRFVKSNV